MARTVERSATYSHLLRSPGVGRVVVTAAIAGIGTTARPVALVLLAREQTGSFASAGLILAGLTAGTMLSSPLRGRQLDRSGYARPLVWLALVTSAATLGLAICAGVGAPVGVSVLLALAAGASSPPVGAALRSLWRQLLGDAADLRLAYALVTMLNEIQFFAGPLLAGLLIGIASPTAALLAAGAMQLLGTVIFALAPAARAAPAQDPEHQLGSPLRRPGVRTILLTGMGFGAVFGALDVALPAFAIEQGSSGGGGLLLACVSPGVVLGGYLYGRRRGDLQPSRDYALLSVLAALGLVPLLAGDSIAAMAALVAVAGAAFAPVTTCLWALIDVVAPEGSHVETTAWLTSLFLAGSVIAMAVTGAIVERGSAVDGFVFALGAAVAAAAVSFARRRSLVDQ